MHFCKKSLINKSLSLDRLCLILSQLFVCVSILNCLLPIRHDIFILFIYDITSVRPAADRAVNNPLVILWPSPVVYFFFFFNPTYFHDSPSAPPAHPAVHLRLSYYPGGPPVSLSYCDRASTLGWLKCLMTTARGLKDAPVFAAVLFTYSRVGLFSEWHRAAVTSLLLILSLCRLFSPRSCHSPLISIISPPPLTRASQHLSPPSSLRLLFFVSLYFPSLPLPLCVPLSRILSHPAVLSYPSPGK